MNHNANLNIIVALHCEAKPFIEELKLSKIIDETLPFQVFTNKQKTIHLIIAGLGKTKATAATMFLYMWTHRQPSSCFLNVGIAGSVCFSIGDCVLANKITEVSTNRNWYPHVTPFKKWRQGQLFTYENPQLSYPQEGMIDMEAAAFFQTASSVVSSEQVQVVKIISDRDAQSQQQINAENVCRLIQQQFCEINMIILYLLELSQQESELAKTPSEFKRFLATWHFTHSQKLELQEYLRRWEVQVPNSSIFDICKNESTPRQVITKIITQLDNHAYSVY